jgi:hypothetical protein
MNIASGGNVPSSSPKKAKTASTDKGFFINAASVFFPFRTIDGFLAGSFGVRGEQRV